MSETFIEKEKKAKNLTSINELEVLEVQGSEVVLDQVCTTESVPIRNLQH